MLLSNFRFLYKSHSKDSDFYLLKDVSRWDTAEELGNIMMNELKRSFDPNEKGHGFYFPGSLKTWEPSFKEVIKDANHHFDKLIKDNPNLKKEEKEQLQGAYIEYVYTLLDSRIELQSVKTLENRGLKNIIVTIIKFCKENVDRGAMENLKYLYYKLGGAVDKIALYIGCAFGRALQVRDRLPLPQRMINVLSLFSIVPQETFKKVQEKYAEELGLGKSNYVPCLEDEKDKLKNN